MTSNPSVDSRGRRSRSCSGQSRDMNCSAYDMQSAQKWSSVRRRHRLHSHRRPLVRHGRHAIIDPPSDRHDVDPALRRSSEAQETEDLMRRSRRDWMSWLEAAPKRRPFPTASGHERDTETPRPRFLPCKTRRKCEPPEP